MNENYIKEINGYKIKDGRIIKLNGTIQSLLLNDPVAVNIPLPDGYTNTNSYILNGTYKIYDTDDNLIVSMMINNDLTDITDGHVTLDCDVAILQNANIISCGITNYISAWVGYKVDFEIIAMKI